MNNMIMVDIPKDDQLRALATRQTFALLESRGIKTYDPRKYLKLSRSDVLDYFRKHMDQATALLNTPKDRPFHDVLCMEARDHRFVIFDMDRGTPRNEMFYDSLEEAATDFVAFTIGYGYPEGYGFKK